MKITKLSIILFIFLLLFTIIPPMGGTQSIESNQSDQTGFGPDQFETTRPSSSLVNASLTTYQRNVTVQQDAKVMLEDEFTLKVLDNTTQIAKLNYSVPSAFANYLHEARFFTQFGDAVGLDNRNNSKEYTVFRGKDVTTYTIDIREDGFSANNSIEGVFVHTRLTAFGLVDTTSYRTGQQGTFMAPITPMFPNMGVEDATIGISISGSVDSIVSNQIDRVENSLGANMPRISSSGNSMTYSNMSRDQFNYNFPLLDKDVTEVIYRSETPIAPPQGQEQAPTTVIPSVIDQANRTVRFDPWGKVYVTEELSIHHLGAPRNSTDDTFNNIHSLSVFLFTVNSDAQVTDVFDELGSLELATIGNSPQRDDNGYPITTSSDSPGKQELSINFRNAIYGGQSYDFTIEYEYNASQVVAVDTETNVYTLNTTLFSDFNTSLWDLNLRYQLPAGSVYQSNSFDAKSSYVGYQLNSEVNRNPMSAFSHLELVYEMTNVSYVDNGGFQISFTYNGMGHFQYLASYLYISIALLAFAYALSSISYKPSKAVEIEKEQTPVDEMDAFFNLFSEKTGAERRLQELRSRRIKKKISKKDYDGKVKSIRRRLRDINPQLEKAASKLSAQGGRYENYVKRVMLASQRQSDIRRNARQAKRSYERGSIPKNIYQLRIKEFNEDLKKQETIINKTLTEMVEIIQKFNQ